MFRGVSNHEQASSFETLATGGFPWMKAMI
jgi:hypothetical protein